MGAFENRESLTISKLCPNGAAIFHPTNNSFPFNNFDAEVHKIIKFEDWNAKTNKIPIQELLQLLEGSQFSTDKKHSDQLSIHVRITIIFISNNPPADDSNKEIIKAFNNRFIVIEANEAVDLQQITSINQQLHDINTICECDLDVFNMNLHKKQDAQLINNDGNNNNNIAKEKIPINLEILESARYWSTELEIRDMVNKKTIDGAYGGLVKQGKTGSGGALDTEIPQNKMTYWRQVQ